MNNVLIEDLRKQVEAALEQDKERYRHTIAVADTSACLAMCHGLNMEKAYIAGLLHDCAKCVPDELKIRECKENNIPINEFEMASPYLLHSKLGAFYAKNKYNIDDEDICNAICYHTTGRAGMSELEKTVYIADYIEPLRNKAAGLDKIRRVSFESLDRAVCIISGDTVAYLTKKGKNIDKATVETYEYYYRIVRAAKQRSNS